MLIKLFVVYIPSFYKLPSTKLIQYFSYLHIFSIMKYFITSLSTIFFFFATIAQQKILGFTDAHATQQKDWEKQFDAQLNPTN